MYKAYLVDDDVHVRRGLKGHFDWAKYGIEVVGEAENGKKAFEELKDNPVDIVITDVKMPKMDGIELACRLRERYKNIKIIFISGHDDLDFLKSSMKVGAVDYILKSIDLDEFAETIRRVTGMICAENEKESLLCQMEKQVRQSMPLLRDKFLMRLVKDTVSPDVDQQLEFLGLSLKKEGSFCAMAATVDNYFDVYGGRGEHDRQLLSFAVLNILQEIVDKYFSGYAFETRLGEYTAVLMLNENEDFETGLLELAAESQRLLSRHLAVSAVMGIGQVVRGLAGLRSSYLGAIKAIERRSYLGGDRAVTVDPYRDAAGKAGDQVRRRELYEKILAGSQQELLGLLREIFQSARAQGEACLKDTLFQLLNLPLTEFEEYRELLEPEFSSARLICERFFCCRELKEMQRLVERLYLSYCRVSRANRENPTSSVILQIRQCMKDRYAENLTVNDIAEAVYLTPTYVCLLFKQKTGVTINDYLTEIRIKKAKELLRDPEKKLYDICFLVGYTSPSYFSKLFKKVTGYTPSEYRELRPIPSGL